MSTLPPLLLRTAALGLALMCAPAFAQLEKRQLRFTLDWVFTGQHAPFLLAADGPFFAAQGLAVQVERGWGAADAVRRVVAGEFDIGLADLSAVIQHNAREPAQPVTAFYLVHERSPLAVISLAERGIRVPADLEGRTLAAPETDAARAMFPLFAAANGIDAGKVRWRSVDPALRESLLVAGDVDAVTGFSTTAQFLQMQGVRHERVRVMRYADFGLDLYSSVLFARADFLRSHPRTVAAVARGANEALKASVADPPAAIDALVRRGGNRVRPDVELQRLRQAIDELLATPVVRRHGLSHVEPERLQRNVSQVVSGLSLPRVPAMATVFDTSFLPPRAERQLPPAR